MSSAQIVVSFRSFYLIFCFISSSISYITFPPAYISSSQIIGITLILLSSHTLLNETVMFMATGNAKWYVQDK